MTTVIPSQQKALVFQGGGALGAYEVGFYEAIYEKFILQKNYKNLNQFKEIAVP